MNSIKIVTVATLLAMGVATAASAQPRDHRYDHRGGPPPMARHGGPGYDRGPGAGPDHAWHRGDRLPSQYRGRQYVVDDWRGHRLSAPPRGYHWVQNGGDYVLAAIATGVIASVLLNH